MWSSYTNIGLVSPSLQILSVISVATVRNTEGRNQFQLMALEMVFIIIFVRM